MASHRPAVAIAYCRVSTSEQELGLDAQSTTIAASAARLGLSVALTFTDAGLSGGLPLEQRPGLLAALDALRKGDVLLVAKRDRIGRDVVNVAMIERLAERKGARIVSASGEGTDNNDPTSRLMRSIVDCFAEYERAVIRARTRAALAVKKTRGERIGGIPFGFRVDGDRSQLTPAADEQAIIRTIRTLKTDGLTMRAIADRLNSRGVVTRRGGSWKHQYIHKLLNSQPQPTPGGPNVDAR